MKLDQISKDDMPIVPVRKDTIVRETNIDALKGKGLGLITYGLNVGEIFEFPESKEDVKIIERQVRPNSSAYEMLILGLKNGRPAYFSVGNLRKRDHKFRPVHPVAEALDKCEDDYVRVEMCLGKKIRATEEVTFDEAIFDDGVRTDATKPRTVAKLVFVE